MTDRTKNTIAAFELVIFVFIVWAAFKAGWITADTERNLYIGGAIGSIIGLGTLIARHRGVRLKQPDNLRLQVALLSQYFAGFLLGAYAIGVSIALVTGDFPANTSVIIAPFAFLAFALAAARATFCCTAPESNSRRTQPQAIPKRLNSNYATVNNFASPKAWQLSSSCSSWKQASFATSRPALKMCARL